MRIELYFHTFPNLELLEKGIHTDIIRLFGRVQFKVKENWSESYNAIVDTGAPFSLLPLEIWQEAEVEILTNTVVRGLVPKKQCVLPVKVGKTTIRLIDEEEHVSNPLMVKAYLAPHNRVPLIIGFQDFLSKMRILFSYQERIAYAEEIG